VFIIGQFKLILERPSKLDRKTLIRTLRADQVAFRLPIGKDITGPVSIPRAVAARR
jgi:hypothetical protein